MKKHSVAWLKRNGFEGLRAPCGECGCDLEDHAPGTECEPWKCRPGYKIPCNPETCCERHNYHITVNKPRRVDPLKTFVP